MTNGYVLNLGSAVPDGLANAVPLAAMSAPVRTNLKAAHYLGHGKAVGVRNWADNTLSTVVGVPTWFNGYAETNYSNCLITNVVEEAAMTFFVVARRKTVSTSVAFFGNYASDTQAGISMWELNTASYIRASIAQTGGMVQTATMTNATDDWGLYGLSVPSSGTPTATGYTTGLIRTATAGDRVINGLGNMRVGTMNTPGFGGTTQILALQIFSGLLSTQDTTAVVNHLRAYATKCGVTV